MYELCEAGNTATLRMPNTDQIAARDSVFLATFWSSD